MAIARQLRDRFILFGGNGSDHLIDIDISGISCPTKTVKADTVIANHFNIDQVQANEITTNRVSSNSLHYKNTLEFMQGYAFQYEVNIGDLHGGTLKIEGIYEI
jgi:hypothetical protein